MSYSGRSKHETFTSQKNEYGTHTFRPQAVPPRSGSSIRTTESEIKSPYPTFEDPRSYLENVDPSRLPTLRHTRGLKHGNGQEDSGHGKGHRTKLSKDKSSTEPSSTNPKSWFNNIISTPNVANQHETQTERYKKEREEWKHKFYELQRIHDGNLHLITQLNTELLQEQERVDRTKRSVNLLETTIDNKEFFLDVQARNDDEVRGALREILSQIKTWSNKFNAGKGHNFVEDMLPEYQRVAPLCSQKSYLVDLVLDKKQKRFFVRGWAAYVMTKLLFRTLDPSPEGGRDVWIESVAGETFSRMENEFWFADRSVISHRAFNDWRAFTADLLSKTAEISPEKHVAETEKAVLKAVNQVMDVVSPWCIHEDKPTIQGYEERLRKIFVKSVELAKFLRRQRALWCLKFPMRPTLPNRRPETGEMMFDSKTMMNEKDVDENRGPETETQQYVEIVLTPALYKRGNTNGEKFEFEEVSCQAVVIIGESNIR